MTFTYWLARFPILELLACLLGVRYLFPVELELPERTTAVQIDGPHEALQ